jgi:hypothetical protein
LLRQRWLTSLASLLLAPNLTATRALAADASGGMESTYEAWNDSFGTWITENQVSKTGLARYYRFGPFGELQSTIATSYAIIYYCDKAPKTAVAFGDALIAMQQRFQHDKLVGGGIPSDPNKSTAGFYASDALLTLDAMLCLYGITRAAKYMESARLLAAFVVRLADGERLGALTKNLSYPITYVVPDGTFENSIRTDVSLMCFKALANYAAISKDRDAETLYEGGRRFVLSEAQSPDGVFYDHYDPGFPPQRYDRNRWRFYSVQEGRSVVLADNALMAGLGMKRLGGQQQLDRFLSWVKPHDGAFYGYTDARTGDSGFLAGSVPYYDIVASGMYVTLVAGTSKEKDPAVRAARQVLERERAADGGWYWGRLADGLHTDNNAEALVTGFWAIRALLGDRWLE